jgi:hypothetical protein
VITKQRQLQAVPLFVLSTVTAENAVSNRYMIEKRRRTLTAISSEFAYSFFILIQIFELLVELKEFSGPLSDDNPTRRRVASWERVTSLCSTKWLVHIPQVLPPGVLMLLIMLFKRQWQHLKVGANII